MNPTSPSPVPVAARSVVCESCHNRRAVLAWSYPAAGAPFLLCTTCTPTPDEHPGDDHDPTGGLRVLPMPLPPAPPGSPGVGGHVDDPAPEIRGRWTS